jgi:aminoglycoside phosphotransferase (APT) family kinase protein
VPGWTGPPLWTHGDLLRGNLLLADGRLTAVIDWSLLGVGDPACDLIVAWSVLPAEVRCVFRSVLGVDDATWLRGRGWALSVALIQLPYYKETNWNSRPTRAMSSTLYWPTRTYVRNILGPLQKGCKEKRTLLSSPST